VKDGIPVVLSGADTVYEMAGVAIRTKFGGCMGGDFGLGALTYGHADCTRYFQGGIAGTAAKVRHNCLHQFTLSKLEQIIVGYINRHATSTPLYPWLAQA
jgi:hypothetical protein